LLYEYVALLLLTCCKHQVLLGPATAGGRRPLHRRWHDDFNTFKGGVKDLEVMLTNVIQIAFDSVSSLAARVELLEAFQLMAKREAILRCIEKKTSEFFNAFMAEINQVKKQFDHIRRSPPKNPILPKYAGQARYALDLMKRLEQTNAALQEIRHMLPTVPEAGETLAAYEVARSAIEQFINNVHKEWFGTIETNISKELEANLLAQDRASGEWRRMHLREYYRKNTNSKAKIIQ
jgi:dynein heavy chain, axonemal